MTLQKRANKSIALLGEGYEEYKGFALNPEDQDMLGTKEEVEQYLKQAVAHLEARKK